MNTTIYTGYIYWLLFPNGKGYIGKTTQKLIRRIQGHIIASQKYYDDYAVHRAVRKYKWENIKVIILATITDPDEKEVDNILKKELEPYYIEDRNTFIGNGQGYNMTTGGEGMTGYKHTKKSKKLMVENHKHVGMTGQKHSEETKRKQSEANSGPNHPNWRRDFTEEHRH